MRSARGTRRCRSAEFVVAAIAPLLEPDELVVPLLSAGADAAAADQSLSAAAGAMR